MSETLTIEQQKERANKFWQNYYGSFEGATIQKFLGMTEDEWGGKPFPVFEVRFANGEVGQIEISQDEEGNGGGFIFGLNLPN